MVISSSPHTFLFLVSFDLGVIFLYDLNLCVMVFKYMFMYMLKNVRCLCTNKIYRSICPLFPYLKLKG